MEFRLFIAFRIFILFVFFISILASETSGQNLSKEHWAELAGRSKAIIFGTVEESFLVIRPEKFKPNPDGSSPNSREFTVGELFRIKVSKKIKGKVKTIKDNKNEYLYVFILGGGIGFGDFGDPVLLPNREYVLFLEPDKNEKELVGKETVEFKPGDLIRKPVEYKSVYSVIHFGAVEIKRDKKELIKEIKRAI